MPDQLSHAEVLARYVATFVDELAAAGVEHVCLCPGSRSTPLALAFERHPKIRTWVHLDERSCAYFALGLGSAASPVAILCSSGTAAANFAPAVIEASYSHRPLIVLTADRPQELRDLGANQTIDQVRLYGSAARWFVEMPLPEASGEMLRYVRMVARRSVRTARGDPAGPVHLNFPFREPLVPAPLEFAAMADSRTTSDTTAAAPAAGETEPSPITSARPGSLEDAFLRSARPLIICGPDAYAHLGAVRRLEAAGVPILAESLSGVRACGPFYRSHILGSYDNFLRSRPLAESLQPDLILRFGAPPTSRTMSNYLLLHRDVPQIVVPTFGDWPDPDLTAQKVEARSPEIVWESLARCMTERPGNWLERWQEAEALSLKAIEQVMQGSQEVSEPSAVIDLAEVIPETYCVFTGNSMPVRDVESFWPAGRQLQFIEGSRGASGIDGVVSTALGAAARCHGDLVLLIGDLSFYHDMNGLLAARRFGLRATIVLINNDGGGIFSFLPQHEDGEHFETLWGTPHGLDFSHVAGLYGVGFQRVTTRREYREALQASFAAEGVQVIEIKTDREENLRLHQRIWAAVAEAVTPLLSGSENS